MFADNHFVSLQSPKTWWMDRTARASIPSQVRRWNGARRQQSPRLLRDDEARTREFQRRLASDAAQQKERHRRRLCRCRRNTLQNTHWHMAQRHQYEKVRALQQEHDSRCALRCCREAFYARPRMDNRRIGTVFNRRAKRANRQQSARLHTI